MGKLFAFALLFGIVMTVYHEVKSRRWKKANPLRDANEEWKSR